MLTDALLTHTLLTHTCTQAVNVLLQSVKTDTPDTEDPSTPVGPAARRARGAGDTTGRGFVAKVGSAVRDLGQHRNRQPVPVCRGCGARRALA